MILRPYQNLILGQARDLMKSGIRSFIIESTPGSGKTVMTAAMVKTAVSRGIRCWFVMHRIELVMQSMETFRDVGVEFGIVAAGFTPDPNAMVQICSVGTLARRIKKLPAPGLVVWDECHHCAAKTYADIHAHHPNAFHVGLSGTPERLDGKGLGPYFKEIIHGPPPRWLIDNGFLAKYKMATPPGINTDGVHRLGGDFNHAELAVVADVPTITGSAVREYIKRVPGKRAIARGVNIHHSKDIVAQFNAAGVPSLHVDGKTPKPEREEAMRLFKSGNILVLSNVDLFSEGINVPAAECVLDLRPTESLTLCLQFWYRAMRPSPGKEYATIIDFAGNYRRHGLPCEPREWNLEGRKKKSKKTATVINTECPVCYGVFIGSVSVCPDCGEDLSTARGGGRTVEHRDGELVEVDLEAARADREGKIAKWREIGAAKTLKDFQALAVKYNYKSGWAYFRFRARNAKKKARPATEGEMSA
jgi:superfamily II DNA or RNA helicase